MTLRGARVVEAAPAWVKVLGYAVLHGPAIAVGESSVVRTDPNNRDALMPNLISGERQVNDAERIVEIV